MYKIEISQIKFGVVVISSTHALRFFEPGQKPVGLGTNLAQTTFRSSFMMYKPNFGPGPMDSGLGPDSSIS